MSRKPLRPPLPHRSVLLACAALCIGAASPAAAQSYDMDCKVILCLAGGFPSGCRDAYRYMMDRITDVPPKPPFGFCAMSNGARYEGTAVDFARLWGRSSYVCRDGLRLNYRVEYLDSGSPQEHAFCYRSSRVVTVGWGRDSRTEVRYEGTTSARRATWRIGITVEPGTPAEYRSPVYFLNRSGIVLQRSR